MNEQIGIAIGQMGMSLDTFERLSPEQFQEAYDAWRIKLEADREYLEILNWQIARWQVWRTLCPPKKKGAIGVMDLIELPGDKELKQQQKSKRKPSTRERFEELKELWKN